MPIQIRNGDCISFRYEPSYLADCPDLRTNFKRDIKSQLCCLNQKYIYSDINLDGGNIVFSPSKKKAVISDRVFTENPEYRQKQLLYELEQLLKTEVIIIPSLKSDMTGHSDGMIRFVDETTVVGNGIPSKNGLEQRIKRELKSRGMCVIDLPYYSSSCGSAVGCYLNFLDTENCLFLPVFGDKMDQQAFDMAKQVFSKEVVPVRVDEIAEEGGGLNCISWEVK